MQVNECNKQYKLSEKNHMIILIDTEKGLDRSFVIKLLENIGLVIIPEHNNIFICETHNHHHPKWNEA